MAAHSAFDPLWKLGRMERRAAYAWLAEQLGIRFQACHIGKFDVDRCKQVIEICRTVPAAQQTSNQREVTV